MSWESTSSGSCSRGKARKLPTPRGEREMPFSPMEEILEDIKAGKMVIVCDDEDRENEGDLTMAAELVTADDINFMATHGRGLICLPMAEELIDRLDIPQMTVHNSSRMGTGFTVSIEAREGITTGISAADRAHTCRVAVDDATGPEDLVMPGHVFPLRAKRGGVLQRAGQTEAAVDLARLAGLKPAGVICEIMNEDGTMARVPDLEKFSAEHSVKMVTVAQIIEYRRTYETLVRCAVETRLPTPFGEFRLRAYESEMDDLTHLALLMGEPEGTDDVLVRVHSACLTGDALHSLRCDCGEQLEAAMERVAAEGEGVIVYMQQEGRGIGLLNKMKAYHLQDEGMDTVEANQKLGLAPDLRDYGIGAQILKELGLNRIRLLTNNLTKVGGLRGFGLEISERVAIEVEPNGHNEGYLKTKREKLNHVFFRQRLEGPRDAMARHGGDLGAVDVVWVPGAYEIPVAAKQLALSGRYDAVICLGAVIRGATAHFDYVAGGAAGGISSVALETNVPVIFGVITTETIEQAIERAGTKLGNKGFEAAASAIEMANLMRQLRERTPGSEARQTSELGRS